MSPYDYCRGEPDVTLALQKANSKWSRSSVKFASAAPAAQAESRIVTGEYFRPLRASNAPLAIILHGLGDHTVFPGKLLARSLVTRGIACLLLYTVFHSSRMPESISRRMPVLTCEEWFEGYRTSVIEVRQAVDWAITRPEINPEQIAIVGMSLGGFAAAIAMGVEERLKAGVFITMGGDAIVTGWESKADTFRKGCNCTEEECRKVHAQYPRYLARVIEEGLENVAPLKQCFLSDTLTYGHRLKDRLVLMINARWDKYIPREAAVRFWEECGRPSIIWLPTGHVTIWGLYPFISRNVARFLCSAFKLQGQQSPKCGQLTRM